MKNDTQETKKQISKLGFGGWQLGSKGTWGQMSFDEGVALVSSAIQQGITFFDTAPGYSNGVSEQIIGEAIKNQRDDVFINSKFGHRADGQMDFDESHMEEAIKESLFRLKTTYLDSCLLHNPSIEILQGKTKHFQEMQRLKQLGLIHAYGVSIDTYHELKTVLECLNVDVIELLFNVFFQETLPLFDEIKKRGIKLIIKVPLDSGWLTGKYDQFSIFTGVRNRWSQEVIKRRATYIDMMKKRFQTSHLVPYTLGFVASMEAVTTLIPGIQSLAQLHDLLESIKRPLSVEDKQYLIDLYLQWIHPNPLPW
jgi:aryl-alcohol dehydrogenase-like predicted oxidoreductase